MIKACIVTTPFYGQNRLFDIHDVVANRDDCLYGFHRLREKFLARGVELSTHDITPVKRADIVLYNDMPSVLPPGGDVKRSYVLLMETEVIRPDNWEWGRHEHFRKIFTWRSDLIDNRRYFKINYPNRLPDPPRVIMTPREKRYVLIAGKKSADHPLELYSRRIEAIRWFERHHPLEFDLFGIGWDDRRLLSPKRWSRKLSRFSLIRAAFGPRFPSYRGPVREKRPVLASCRFAICYENVRDLPGYITEKIFDCFFAGCIPIYWGAGDITNHIPRECFIDMRNFKDYDSLYFYCSSLSEAAYREYVAAIAAYLDSDRAYPFTADHFADTIIRETVGEN